MPHSTDSSFDKARIYLVIDQVYPDLSDIAGRRCLLNLEKNLTSLEWTYNCAEGGFGQASASAKVPEGSWARRQLELRNYSVAYIYYAPPETEGPVLMTDYDSKEGEFILWTGFVDDVDISPKDDIVKFNMSGLGEFLSKKDATRAHTRGSTIGGYQTFNKHATNDGNAMAQGTWTSLSSSAGRTDIMNDGGMHRKGWYSEGYSDVESHTSNIADLLGGHPMVAWGMRNNAGASTRGQYYFSLLCDPAREQTSSDANFNNRTTPYISPLEVVSVTAEDDTSKVINSVRIFRPWDGTGDANRVSDGYAQNTVSINRIGLREKIISDSSIEDTSQASDRAASFVAANSSNEILINAEILHDPRPAYCPNAAGQTYLPLMSAIKDGTIKLNIPFQERASQDRANRGDSVNSVFEIEGHIADIKKGTSVASTLLVDCRTGSPSKTVPNAPSGLYSGSPNWKSGGDLNASMTVYNLQFKYSDSSELADGSGSLMAKSMAICEWDRQLYLAFLAQGTTPQTYVPYVAFRNSSGSWASAGSFTADFGSTITKANLTAGVNVVIGGYSTIGGSDDTEIEGLKVRVYMMAGAQDNPSGARTLLWSGTRSVASTSTFATDGSRVFFVNKNEGNNGTSGTTTPALSKSMKLYECSIYGSLGETDSGVHKINGKTFSEFADEIVWQQPLLKHANKRILEVHTGCSRAVETDDVVDSNTKKMVQIAYFNTGSFTEGGDFAHLISDNSSTTMSTETLANSRRANTWLIGAGDTGYGGALGPDITVAPRVVSCSLESGKIKMNIQGNGRPFSATFKIEQTSKELNEIQQNQYRGQS